MKKVTIGLSIAVVLLAGYAYFSNPYRECQEVSVGSSFSAGYDCGDKTVYIPKR